MRGPSRRWLHFVSIWSPISRSGHEGERFEIIEGEARLPHCLLRYVLPNMISPVVVLATAGVGIAILIAAGLSYLGLGAQPPTPEWGAMLSEARAYLRNAWWMATFPGLAITLVVISLNLCGDWLRDQLDPRLRT